MRQLNNIRNHSNWISYYIYKFFTSQKESFTFKCRSGINTTVPKRLLHTYKEVFFDQIYIKKFPNNDFLKGEPTIIDIGANVGYFSLFALSKNLKAKVYSYEPMPNNFELLSKYKRENSKCNFNPFNLAVGSAVGTITLNYNASDSFTTSASILPLVGENDQIKVKTTTLAEIIESNNIKQIDFLKLDCEGSEYDILYNSEKMLLQNIKTMAIETHIGTEKNHNMACLVDFLKKNNFELKTEGSIIWGWRI